KVTRSGPPSKPPFRLRSMSVIEPSGGGSTTASVTPAAWPASSRSSARRGAWSEATAIRGGFSRSRQRATASPIRCARPGGSDGGAGRRGRGRPAAGRALIALRGALVPAGRTLQPSEVGGEPLGQLRRHPSEPGPDGRLAGMRKQELRGRQELDAIDAADRALVGRIEAPQRIDLVAEEVDPHGQRRRGREDVDDAASARELTTARDLHHRRVTQLEELAEELALVDPGAGTELA